MVFFLARTLGDMAPSGSESPRAPGFTQRHLGLVWYFADVQLVLINVYYWTKVKKSNEWIIAFKIGYGHFEYPVTILFNFFSALVRFLDQVNLRKKYKWKIKKEGF